MIHVLLVAGGSGTRMQSELPKQFLPLAGKTVLWHTVDRFHRSFPNAQIVLVLPDAFFALAQEQLGDHPAWPLLTLTGGGKTRFHSVRNGLQTLAGQGGWVLVHDAVRPCLSIPFLQGLAETARQFGNAVPCTEVRESLREVSETENHAVDRSRFRAIQTPQGFSLPELQQAFLQPFRNEFTDEASVAEAFGIKVHLCQGLEENIKITRPADIPLCEWILARQA